MAITDLTGYTWVANNGLTFIGGSSTQQYYIEGHVTAKNYDTGADITYSEDLNSFYFFFHNSQASAIELYDAYDDDICSYRLAKNYWENSWDGYRIKDVVVSITGGTDATNPDLIAWLEANGTLIAPQPTKTFDLSTLQLSAGTHTVQVRARATGYRDSEFSNSEIYINPISSGGSND